MDEKEGYFATHDVLVWGVKNFCNRADRYKRDFVEDGKIKKLDDDEKAFRGFSCRDDVYTIVLDKKTGE